MTQKKAYLALLAAVLFGCGGGGGGPTAPSPTNGSDPSAVAVLSTAEFQATVLQPGVVAMVEFFSPYCSHCRSMDPIIESVARDYVGRAIVAKLDGSADPTLLDTYEIIGYPTFVFFRDGVEVERLLGTQLQEILVSSLDSALAGS
jgi:thiol-disulfide isomerase/thioredoxin